MVSLDVDANHGDNHDSHRTRHGSNISRKAPDTANVTDPTVSRKCSTFSPRLHHHQLPRLPVIHHLCYAMQPVPSQRSARASLEQGKLLLSFFTSRMSIPVR